MLARVSEALAKFLSPLSHSFDHPPEQESSPQKKEVQEVSAAVAEKKETQIQDSQVNSETLTPIAPPALSNVTEILVAFKNHRKVLASWGGARAYLKALRPKSLAQIRKGAILDESEGPKPSGQIEG